MPMQDTTDALGQRISAFKGFRLPQFQTSSQAVNQANSDAMKPTGGDLYSDANNGIKFVAAPRAMEKQVSDKGNYSIVRNDGTDAPASPVGEKENTSPKIHTSAPAMEDLFRKTQQATDPSIYQQDIDNARKLSNEASTKRSELASYNPYTGPVSKGRKIGAIATGILTGLASKNPEAGIENYRKIAYGPNLVNLGIKKQQAEAADQAAKDAAASATRGIEAVKAQGTVGGVLGSQLKELQGAQQYEQTGAQKEIAETGKNIAEGKKAEAEIPLLLHPKPEAVTTQPGSSLSIVQNDPGTGTVNVTTSKPAGSIQKLLGEDELQGRRAASAAGLDPNKTLEAYYRGDPQASELIGKAVEDYHKSLNPAYTFGEPSQANLVYNPDGSLKGNLIFDPRKKDFTFKSAKDMGIEGSFERKPPEKLNANAEGQYRAIKNFDKLGPAAIQEIEANKAKLGAIKGRIKNFLTEDVGKYDPSFAALQTTLKALSPVVAAAHPVRLSKAVLGEFEGAVGDVHQHPDNLIAKIKELLRNTDAMGETIESQNPNALEVLASKSLPEGDGKEIDRTTAEKFYEAAGRDPQKAQELAEQHGWKVSKKK